MDVQEMLVHLSGLNSKKDDQRYRNMVHAYGNFQPRNRVCMTSSRDRTVEVIEPGEWNSARALSPPDEDSTSFPVAVINTRPSVQGATSFGRIGRYTHDTATASAALESQLLTSSLLIPTQSRENTPASAVEPTASLERISEDESHVQVQQISFNKGDFKVTKKRPKSSFWTVYGDELMDHHSQERSGRDPNTIEPDLPDDLPIANPTTFITPKLQQLADMLDISRRFQPSTITRKLYPEERGYWRIDTSTWSSQLRTDFWSYLREFVGSGAAGLIIFCYREPTNETEPSVVRIYCWGEVVGHMYLLTFVASKSKVKQTKPTWIDARGKAVVKMP